MRTFLTSFTAVVLALSFLSSCGDEASPMDAANEIKVASLEDACQFATAMTTVSKAVVALQAEIDKEEAKKATSEQKENMDKLNKMSTDMTSAHTAKDIKLTDIAKCEGYTK